MIKRPTPNLTVLQQMRFWDRVEKTDTCWLWTGSRCQGYGFMGINYSMFYTHRISYKLHYKEPNQLEVCHDCHVKLCIRPEHLYLGTHQENIQHNFDDGIQSNKGELHPNATLLQEEINEVVELLNEDNLTHKEIWTMYRISRTTLKRIKRGIHWGVRDK